MGIYNPPPAGSGSGDMNKSTYDTDDDGKVNSAVISDSTSAVTWSNVSGKPAEFPAEAHGHAISDVSGLSTALSGKLATPTGTPDGTKYLRDDNSWQALTGGSGLQQYQVRQLTRR